MASSIEYRVHEVLRQYLPLVMHRIPFKAAVEWAVLGAHQFDQDHWYQLVVNPDSPIYSVVSELDWSVKSSLADKLRELGEDLLWEKLGVADKPFISDWSKNLDWQRRGADYWKSVFCAARLESRMPPGISTRVSKRTQSKQWFQALEDVVPPGVYRLPTQITHSTPSNSGEWIRQMRWIHRALDSGELKRLPHPDPVQRYGPFFGRLVDTAIVDMVKGLDCVDNTRFADYHDKWETKAYRRAKHHGCCSSIDKLLFIGDRTFRLGCNYGH